MGEKGAKLTSESILATELFLERIGSIEGVTSKKMFGGHGIFHEGKMFGLVDSKGNYFLKADDSNREDYLTRGSVQHSRMPYYSIPAEVLEDPSALISWTEKSIDTIQR